MIKIEKVEGDFGVKISEESDKNRDDLEIMIRKNGIQWIGVLANAQILDMLEEAIKEFRFAKLDRSVFGDRLNV